MRLSACPRFHLLSQQRGVSMIEVLITLIILLVGLLGLTGLMVQSQRSQVESYERVQALMLMEDIVSKMSANKEVASCYVVDSLGTGTTTIPACAAAAATKATRAVADLTAWRDLLLGAAETSGGASVGAVLGARGCVELVAGTTSTYRVSVAWQGRSPTGGPPADITCGVNQYDASGDAQRRAVSVTVPMS